MPTLGNACLSTYPVKFEVETTGVTHGLPLGVAPPERGGVGPAVGADHPRASVSALQWLRS